MQNKALKISAIVFVALFAMAFSYYLITNWRFLFADSAKPVLIVDVGSSVENIATDADMNNAKFIDENGKSIGEIEMQDNTRVLSWDMENNRYQYNTVELIEQKIKQEENFYLLNKKTLVYGNQSIFANGGVIHVKDLKIGDQLTGLGAVNIDLTSLEQMDNDFIYYRLNVDGDHTYFLDGILMHNASRYWVNGTGNWNDYTNHWSGTSGGLPGASTPTSADDCMFDLNSGGTYTVTTNVVANCNDLAWYVGGTPTWAGSSATNVYGSLAMDGLTTRTYTGTITFKSPYPETIVTNGITMASSIVFNGSGGTWTLQDALNNGTSNITLTEGTFDLQNYTLTFGSFSSDGSATREIKLGNSTINCVSWQISGPTYFTLTTGESTLYVSGDSEFIGGAKTYYIVSLTSSGNVTLSGANTFYALGRTGTAVKTDKFTLKNNQTITGTLSILGNSISNRMLVMSDVIGTSRTLTAGTVTVTNSDFQDITGAGLGSWNLSAISGNSGDCGGNSSITFTTAESKYWVDNDGGYWNTTASWATSTGATSGTRVPLCQDDVYLDAQSILLPASTIYIDMPRAGKSIDMTGLGSNPTISLSNAISIYGALTLATSTPLTMTSGGITFAGRSTHTVTSAGNDFGNTLTFSGGTYTLQDNLVVTSTNSTLYLTKGTFDANDYNVTAPSILSYSGYSRTTKMGNGTWSTYRTIGPQWLFDATGLTLDEELSTIKLIASSSLSSEIKAGGETYNNIWVATNGSGFVSMSGSNTFNDFEIDKGREVLFQPESTTTMASFTANGQLGQEITIDSTSTGTPAYLVKTGSGVVSVDYLIIGNLHVSPANTWYAGVNSTDAGGNSGWIFTAPPGVLIQSSYQWLNDDGANVNSQSDYNATTTADVAITDVEIGQRQDIRIQVINTSTSATSTAGFVLQFCNYTDDGCDGEGDWTNAGASTAISYSLGLAGSDDASITASSCATSTATWVNGYWNENSATSSSITLSAQTYTELGYMIQTSNATVGKEYWLRLVSLIDSSTSALSTYTEYPSLTIVSTTTVRYSKENAAVLLLGITNLTYYLDYAGYTKVATDDSSRDGMYSSSLFSVFNFAKKHTDNTTNINVTWNGQSSLAATSSDVKLQIYRASSTNAWEVLDSNITAINDVDFDLSGSITANLDEYYQSSNWVYLRVYQQLLATPETLRTDYIDIDFSTPAYSISFAISDNTAGFGSLSSSGNRFATGDTSGNDNETIAHTITATTTSPYGYSITASGTTMMSGSQSIDPIGSSAASSTAGTEQFGMRLGVASGVGIVASPYNMATSYAFATSSMPDLVASDTLEGTTVYNIYYVSNIALETEAGDYSASIVYTCTGNF